VALDFGPPLGKNVSGLIRFQLGLTILTNQSGLDGDQKKALAHVGQEPASSILVELSLT
jgi:hypothetical protein